jgi:hypothetical protein
MTNAKEEFLEAVTGRDVVAAIVKHDGKTFLLRQGYTVQDRINFLNNLDFEYRSGYGAQNLFGTVWLKNGKWLDRGEYDGSEWWELREMPAIPLVLL